MAIAAKPNRGNRWNSNIPIDYIRELYLKGLSTRQIAVESGWSKSRIATVCKDIARTQEAAAILRHPATSKHWRSSRQAARKVYERYHNIKLSTKEHIHHKNHDHTDNRIENLEILSASDHAKYHHPKNPIPRHLRPERQEYMKAYLKKYRKVK